MNKNLLLFSSALLFIYSLFGCKKNQPFVIFENNETGNSLFNTNEDDNDISVIFLMTIM